MKIPIKYKGFSRCPWIDFLLFLSYNKNEVGEMLFTKKTEIYESRDREEWKRAKSLLKAAGIARWAGHTELSPPVGGCGAKIDIRKAGGNYDPETYYIRVAADRAEEAKALLSRALGRVLL